MYCGVRGEAMWNGAADKPSSSGGQNPSPTFPTGICGAQSRSDPPPSGQCLAIAPVVILARENIENMAKRRTGGKAACQKQRDLRALLLATANVREDALTVSDVDWKAVLKNLRAGVEIVGTGACKFTFRLLRDVRNPKYITFDSRDSNVLEVIRTDGSAVHLHFHKNGKCDKPEVFVKDRFDIGAGKPDNMIDELEIPCPATSADIVHSDAPGSNLPLGRNENAMALESLLHVMHEGGADSSRRRYRCNRVLMEMAFA